MASVLRRSSNHASQVNAYKSVAVYTDDIVEKLLYSCVVSWRILFDLRIGNKGEREFWVIAVHCPLLSF